MAYFLVTIIRTLAQVLTIVIIVDALLSFFVSPFHPIREALGKILTPLYTPIRRFVPAIGGIDFSPIVLILLVQLVEWALIQVIVRL